MNLRQAREGDAAEIAAISNAIIKDSLITFTTDTRSVASVASDIRERGPGCLVAELEGRVAGFATYGPFRRGVGYARCCEHTIQLAPHARGQGLGRGLMSALEARAVADGIHVMVAGISSANPDGVAFHAALGFAEVGRMPEVGRKWGRWLDLVLMQKILPPQ